MNADSFADESPIVTLHWCCVLPEDPPMHAELLLFSVSTPNGFDRLDYSKVGFASQNKASPVEKISSSRNRDMPISSEHLGTQAKRENQISAGFLATQHPHEDKQTPTQKER